MDLYRYACGFVFIRVTVFSSSEIHSVRFVYLTLMFQRNRFSVLLRDSFVSWLVDYLIGSLHA